MRRILLGSAVLALLLLLAVFVIYPRLGPRGFQRVDVRLYFDTYKGSGVHLVHSKETSIGIFGSHIEDVYASDWTARVEYHVAWITSREVILRITTNEIRAGRQPATSNELLVVPVNIAMSTGEAPDLGVEAKIVRR
jgi:hypothetical protein